MSQSLADTWPKADGYLLNHSAGLPPRDSAQVLTETLFGPWTGEHSEVWPNWLRAIDVFRQELAAVLNSGAELVCPQPSVSTALTQVLGSLDVKPDRRRLLIAERAFPSLGFVFAQLERRGFEVVMVPKGANTLDPAAWAPYLDERVHCVLLTHVHSNTSECHDIQALAAAARRVGAISVVDVAQSIGIRETDTQAWGADFVIGSCIKWLCGGPGAGFLWVNGARLQDCEPIDVGWFSHADPFEFDIHHFAYAPDALRFWGGTPSVAPAITAAHSIASLRRIGLAEIRARNKALTDQLIDGLPPQSVRSPRQWEQRGGSVVVNLGDQQADFIDRLHAAGLQFDARAEGVRLSPHFYNTPEDVERVLACQ